ncbi:hypothetical protein [Meiothermus ruber]|uniref:hypothetical protein n=1 Tax=Meiothermus ruber TaxID=277 RepID=UPI0012E04D77|nr:hypothetical protein [Meiothermus ruber]
MSDTLTRKEITYTYTLPTGAEVVIFGVPALCDEESEDEFCGFEPEVVDRLSELIDSAAAQNPRPGLVVSLQYSDDPQQIKPDVDLELRVKGPGITLGEIPINVLQKLLENASSAFRLTANAIAKKQNLEPPPPPQVAFLASGSVVIGLRSGSNRPLFGTSNDPSLLALDLLIQGIEWSQEGIPDNVDPDLAIAAIEGAKQLAPGPRENFRVEVTRYEERRPKRVFNLASDFRSKGSKAIEKIATQLEHKKVAYFSGQLDQIKLDGQAHLRQLKIKPSDYSGQVITFSYPENLLNKLLSHFGKFVHLVAEEEQTIHGKQYNALDVEVCEAENNG